MILVRLRRFCTVLGVTATIAVCGATMAASPDSAQIPIKEFMFLPGSATIKAGSNVTWSNKDDEPHNLVSDTGLFRSGAVDTDETFTFKFDKPGTYHYHCSLHTRMVGTIVVE